MTGKVLIVDDDRATRNYIASCLQEAGYQTETAVNGAEGLVYVKKNEYDLLLVDVNMPILDGLKMVTAVRKDNLHVDKPIVILTAQQEIKLVNRFANLDIDDYVLKSTPKAELLARINEVFASDKDEE